MTRLLSVVCFSICVSMYSMEKVRDIKNEKEKKIMDTTEASTTPKEITYTNPLTGEEIPKKWIEIYNIKEDPLGEKERAIYGMNPEDFVHEIPEINETVVDNLDDGVDASILNDNSTDSQESNTTCKICQTLEESKRLRIENIRTTILNKIGFSNSNLPNMTGKVIPRVPSIELLMEQYTMQGDAPYGVPDDLYYPEEDEFYGQIKKAYTISQTRKFLYDTHIIFCSVFSRFFLFFL